MADIRRCYNEKCNYNHCGSTCGSFDVVINCNGCCEDYIPPILSKTNADRIRAMSDEELEEFIRRISIAFEPWCDNHCKLDNGDNCNTCLREWLKQPVEE